MPGSRRTRAIVAAVLIGTGSLVGALVTAAPGMVATVGSQATRTAPPHRALLVSDSAWLGIKTYGAIDAVQGFEHMFDLGSCRRRVVNSCRNYDGHVPITMYEEIAWRGGTFDTLVVATGYNDSDRRFAAEVDTVVTLARANGYRRVVWLTLRSNVAYVSQGNAGFAASFERANQALADIVAAGTYPELVIADWAGYAEHQHAWFANDGIHLRTEGPWAAADYISRKLAFLEGRACPQPARPGASIPDRCPDPDLTGPTIDLRGLYPIGLPNPTTGFQMEWAGHSSWPAPAWWER